MSVSHVHHDSTEPDWTKGKTLGELGRMISDAQIHVSLYHKRREEWRVADLMAELTISYLDGNQTAPEHWRPRIASTLERLPYKEGCCTWRS